MNALKAQWKISAGILLGQPMEEFEKVFSYTSKMYDDDQRGSTHYLDMLNEVHDYAKSLSNPGIINWLTVDFVWI